MIRIVLGLAASNGLAIDIWPIFMLANTDTHTDHKKPTLKWFNFGLETISFEFSESKLRLTKITAFSAGYVNRLERTYERARGIDFN